MTEEKKLPTGIQTFSEIIKDNYLYVDKTDLMHKLVTTKKYVFLSRPRRFGKSLLASTMSSYFKGEKELFKGLAIEKLEKEWKQYPVLRLDLSGTSYQDVGDMREKIDMYLTRWENEYGLKASGKIAPRFAKLIYHIFEVTGKKIVVLIDEYDKPLLDTLSKRDLHEITREELSGFYSVLKENDEYIKFGLITGITKFGKVNIFSGFNNLTDISLYPEYNALCGITETEFRTNFKRRILQIAKEWNWSEEETWENFKKKYDGYLFAYKGENIYNPYSVLSAFDALKLKDFWFGSGSSKHLIDLLKQTSMPFNELEGSRRSERVLSDITDLNRDIVPLLYQAGYLTIKSYDPPTDTYTLGFPNEEVVHAFWESLAEYFLDLNDPSNDFDAFNFAKDVNEGRPKDFLNKLKALLADTSPGVERNKEVHFSSKKNTLTSSKIIELGRSKNDFGK